MDFRKHKQFPSPPIEDIICVMEKETQTNGELNAAIAAAYEANQSYDIWQRILQAEIMFEETSPEGVSSTWAHQNYITKVDKAAQLIDRAFGAISTGQTDQVRVDRMTKEL